MLNALVSLNLFDAAHSVSGRGQVNPFNYPAREAGETQAQAGAELLNTGLVCSGLDNTRSDGTAHSHARLVG